MSMTGRLAAIFISGLLFAIAFPPLDMWYVAWVGLVPLLVMLRSASWHVALLAAFLFGVVACALHVWWMNLVPAFPALAFLTIICYAAIFFGIFGLVYRLLTRYPVWFEVVGAALVWTGLEYLRSNLGFLSIPWVLAGYTQYTTIPVLQFASLASVYGVSFLVVIVNAMLARFVPELKRRRGQEATEPANRFTTLTTAAMVLTCIVMVTGWGTFRVLAQEANDENRAQLRVALIQGNVPEYIKRDAAFNKEVMEKYKRMSAHVALENPDLIVWPETATPGYLSMDKSLAKEVSSLVRATDAYYLIGSSTIRKGGMGEKRNYSSRNSAFLLNPDGNIVTRYDKVRLLPFAEYLPARHVVHWPKWLVPVNGVLQAGRTHEVFDMEERRFGVVICWESLFPELFREFVRQGAEFMVNITNEAWFEDSWASPQLLAMSVFRAVENGVPLLRVANTGISTIIDPYGRIGTRVVDIHGNDQRVEGSLIVDVPNSSMSTFYGSYGDKPLLAVLIIGMIILIMVGMLDSNRHDKGHI